jgi:uncharacterized membrane protein
MVQEGDKVEGQGFWGPFAYFLPILGPIVVLLARRDSFSRFHAVQSILATVALILVGVVLLIFALLPIFGFLYAILLVVFKIGAFVVWGFLMYKAWRGERYKLPYIGDWASGPEEPPAA